MKRNGWIALVLMAALAIPTVAAAKTGSHWDKRSERLVREQFKGKDALKGVSVSVEDGIATLTGDVNLLIHKVDAEKRAKRADRVAGVRNEIRVVPSQSVTDQALHEKLATKLAYDRVGFGNVWNALALKVDNGVATLTGKVHDYISRDSALALVQTTPGVRGLIDDIDVAPASGFDDDLRINMARTIYGHPSLQRYATDPQMPIRIVVESGKVELHGVVGSKTDKQIAMAQARSVPGAFSVEDRLLVATE